MHASPTNNVYISIDNTIDTEPKEIATIVESVANKADEWKNVPVKEKIALLKQVIANAIHYKKEWIQGQQQARGVESPQNNVLHSYGYLDILVSGPATFGGFANAIVDSLEEIDRTGGASYPPVALRTTSNGHTVAKVWPRGILQSLEAFGMK
eukprot:15353734-Ditylum_brightwellii.AAC.1